MANNKTGFTSSFGVVMAAAGSAVGLGNIWRFPYICGQYGGAACLFVYLLFVFLIGMVIHWLPERFKRRYRLWFAQLPLWLMLPLVVLGVFIVYQFITADLQPFIYFQF
jgi:hypothetical protein